MQARDGTSDSHACAGTGRIAHRKQAHQRETPDGEYMITRGSTAKIIFDEFVTEIQKDDDLQRKEHRRANTAERAPTQTVAALHPSKPLSETASIKQQIKGFDSRLAVMKLMVNSDCATKPRSRRIRSPLQLLPFSQQQTWPLSPAT